MYSVFSYLGIESLIAKKIIIFSRNTKDGLSWSE
jgi:hypothetical protein